MAYIPSKDAELLVWSENFATRIVNDPARYGLLADDAQAINAQYVIFHDAYVLAVNPSTRTKLTVADKDGEKLTLLEIVRMYAAMIRANQGVTTQAKADLGLNIPDPTPTPIPVPTTTPDLSVVLSSNSVHQLSVRDSLTPTKKAKPYGVVGCQLVFVETASSGSAPMESAPTLAIVTTSDFTINTAAMTPGKWAHYRARWFNRKGEFGPWGYEIAFVVPGQTQAVS